MKDAKFASMMSDGSTDCAVKGEVGVRFARRGTVEVKFAGI